jgi:hypothetical protein
MNAQNGKSLRRNVSLQTPCGKAANHMRHRRYEARTGRRGNR